MLFAAFVCELARVYNPLIAAVFGVVGVGAWVVASWNVVTVHLSMWLRLGVGLALGRRRV